MSKEKKNAKKAELSYDEAIIELETIMGQLQDENVGLDKMTVLVDRAATLIKYCQQKLKGIKQKVEEIFEGQD